MKWLLPQCDIIPYTTDVDIGIFAKDYNPALMEEFVRNGFQLIQLFGRLNDSFELAYTLNGIKLDIFLHYEDEDGSIWCGGTDVPSATKFKYTTPHFSLCWTEFMDLILRIPCPTLPYITAYYGNQWSTPKEEWDWKKLDGNGTSKENGKWPEAEWPEVMQVFGA